MARVYTPYVMGSEIVRRQKAYTKDDLVKTRFVFRLLFLVAFMAILSLFTIWSRVQIVHTGYEINSLQSRQHQLSDENKKLRVETATLKAPARLEQVAKTKLKMSSPSPEKIRMVSEPP